MKTKHFVACHSKVLAEMIKASHPNVRKAGQGHWLYKDQTVIQDDSIKDMNIHSVHYSEELNFSDYADAAKATAIYPGQGTFLGLIYVALKGAGEAGEFAENVGKALRDDKIVENVHGDEVRTYVEFNSIIDWDERRMKLIDELGDELWYIAAKAEELGVRLVDVAARNVRKLAKRAAEGKIQGSGSDR